MTRPRQWISKWINEWGWTALIVTAFHAAVIVALLHSRNDKPRAIAAGPAVTMGIGGTAAASSVLPIRCSYISADGIWKLHDRNAEASGGCPDSVASRAFSSRKE